MVGQPKAFVLGKEPRDAINLQDSGMRLLPDKEVVPTLDFIDTHELKTDNLNLITQAVRHERNACSIAVWTSVILMPVAANLAEVITQFERGVFAAVRINSASS